MSTILGQKTMPWGNEHLGTSNFYIWAKGCTITELAECLETTPDVVNNRLNALPADAKGNTGFAKDANGQNDLVYWPRLPEAFPGVTFNRVWTYNNDAVFAQLAAGHRVMVEVPADPIGTPGGKHWVRFIGEHKLHDPWTGTERPTSDFPNPTGYCVISGKWEQEKPVDEAKPETYKGLDLTNVESVKAAIDTWKEVEDGVFIRKDAICQALEVDASYSQEALVEAIKTLKTSFKEQVQVATGLPSTEQVEGQGPAVTPVQPSLVNVPNHEKDSVLDEFHAFELKVKSLFGL